MRVKDGEMHNDSCGVLPTRKWSFLARTLLQSSKFWKSLYDLGLLPGGSPRRFGERLEKTTQKQVTNTRTSQTAKNPT